MDPPPTQPSPEQMPMRKLKFCTKTRAKHPPFASYSHISHTHAYLDAHTHLDFNIHGSDISTSTNLSKPPQFSLIKPSPASSSSSSKEELQMMIQSFTYWLSEHPSIVGFRWNHSQSWGSTWSFLFTSIAAYITFSLFLRLVLAIFRRQKPVPLGLIPAIHSLSIALVSIIIFVGILFSSASEIRDTRWFWTRSKTPFQWFLCFPLGTRPTGRVFFWSYIFYLSRFLHLFRTFFSILRHRKLSFFRLFNQSILLCMSFLWLEFSQSFQVVGILLTTLVYSVVYGYRFWTGIGLPSACFPFVVNCQIVLLGCNLICHVGVLLLHFRKGGCNGIGAWVFNSVLNAVILLLFMNFYVKMHLKKRRRVTGVEEEEENESETSNPKMKIKEKYL